MRILIVGAGPTGAALSLLLARRGIDVVLLEKERDFERIFRGEALMPSGVDAIAEMGLREEFECLPQRIVECMEFHVEGTRVIRADWPEVAGSNAVRVVSQPALLDMLTRQAARQSTFELRMGSGVRDVTIGDEGVELLVHDGEREGTLHGDFVIGADGRASMVRARLGIDIERFPSPFDVAWFSLPLPSHQREDPRFQAYGRGGKSVAMYPAWDGRLRLGLNVSAVRPGHRAKHSKEELLEEAARIVDQPNAAFIRGHVRETTEPIVLKVLFGRCPQWTAPRTLLLGDAAHPMSPVRAQGINLALRDAIVAANHLAPAADTGDPAALEAAAEHIQREREPEIIESQRLQVAVAKPPPPVRSAFLRATVLPLLQRLGIVKRLFLKAEIPLRHGIVQVQLDRFDAPDTACR